MYIYSIQFQSHCNILFYPRGAKIEALPPLEQLLLTEFLILHHQKPAGGLPFLHHFTAVIQRSQARIKKLPRPPKSNHSFVFVFFSEDQQISTDLGQNNSMNKDFLFYPFSGPVFLTFHFPSLSQFLIYEDLRKFLNELGSIYVKMKF